MTTDPAPLPRLPHFEILHEGFLNAAFLVQVEFNLKQFVDAVLLKELVVMPASET